MGTEIQSKMYLPGYYTTPSLTTNVGHIGWSLLNENKSLTNGQQYDIISTKHECSKEQVRQMILKHDSIFKHQLTELHRLYERQKDLMNEIKSKELLKTQSAAAASQLPIFSSGISFVGSGQHKPSMSTFAVSNQSYCNSIGNTPPTRGRPSQIGVKKLQRRLFNLELPADQYISDEEEPEEVLSGSAKEDYTHNRRNENKVSFVHPGGGFGDNNDASVSGLDKMSVSRDDVYRGVWPFAKKFPEKPLLVKNGGVSNLHLKNDSNQKEWLANAINADQTRTFSGNDGLRDFEKTNAPSLIEAWKACEPAKRKLFGVEISDRSLNASSQASKSDVAAMSESSPTWARPPSSVSNNRTSVELSHQNGSFFSGKFDNNESHSNLPSIVAGFPYSDSSHSSSLKDFTLHGAQCHYPSVGCKADAKSSTNVHDKGSVNILGNRATPQGRLHWLESASLSTGPFPLAADNNSAKVSIFKMQNDKACSKRYIDLNTCLTEEESQIDVQAPVLVARYVNMDKASEERIRKELSHSSQDGPIRVAAETLVAFSSSQAREMQENAAHGLRQEVSACREDNTNVIANSLMWFAEIASSNEQGHMNNGESISACDEDSFINLMDHFEYMTLSIVETELDEFCNATSDNPKEEISLSKQPQWVRTRRGRQKKDFQRDVLSGIACLSRNEVTEDLETFEESIRAIGGSWQSGSSKRNACRVDGRRGCKRSGSCTRAPTSTMQAAVSQPQCGELQELEKRSTAVTGKRTRRPPRQRYLIYSSPVFRN